MGIIMWASQLCGLTIWHDHALKNSRIQKGGIDG